MLGWPLIIAGVVLLGLIYAGLWLMVFLIDALLTDIPHRDPELWDADPQLAIDKANGPAYRATLDWSAGNRCEVFGVKP